MISMHAPATSFKSPSPRPNGRLTEGDRPGRVDCKPSLSCAAKRHGASSCDSRRTGRVAIRPARIAGRRTLPHKPPVFETIVRRWRRVRGGPALTKGGRFECNMMIEPACPDRGEHRVLNAPLRDARVCGFFCDRWIGVSENPLPSIRSGRTGSDFAADLPRARCTPTFLPQNHHAV